TRDLSTVAEAATVLVLPVARPPSRYGQPPADERTLASAIPRAARQKPGARSDLAPEWRRKRAWPNLADRPAFRLYTTRSAREDSEHTIRRDRLAQLAQREARRH